MMKLLTRGNRGRRLAASAAALATLTCGLPAAAVQQGTPHVLHTKHRVPAASAAPKGEQSILAADDARFFLTRVGFAPDSADVAQYVGLTRVQAVDKALATTRTEAVTPVPDWMLEPIPTCARPGPTTSVVTSSTCVGSVTKYYARGGYARC
jgi:uncharacterized protein (DUF1800 family)